jgi:hypothetical protein
MISNDFRRFQTFKNVFRIKIFEKMKNVVKTYEKRFLTFYFGSYEFPQ